MDVKQMALLAGTISSGIFTASHIPMVVRALRTRDLRSYSLANLALINLGNLFYWPYVASLPLGPIWFLHSFYTLVSIGMLLLYLRHRNRWVGVTRVEGRKSKVEGQQM